MTCFLFSHALDLHARFREKTQDENMAFLPGMPLKPSQLPINVISQTVLFSWNSVEICIGESFVNNFILICYHDLILPLRAAMGI